MSLHLFTWAFFLLLQSLCLEELSETLEPILPHLLTLLVFSHFLLFS